MNKATLTKIQLLLALSLAISMNTVIAEDTEITHTFKAGEPALASEVNENFSDLAAAIDAKAGVAGPQGDQGPKGDTGSVGPRGVAGPNGIDGAPGDKGDAGINGATWLSGTVAPTDEGVDGDLYLNTTDSQVYKKETGAWVATVNIKGLQGIQGLTGGLGLPGANGTDGAQGPKGDKGADSIVPGPRGLPGTNGSNGTNGQVGPRGLPGTDGSDGAAGAQGPAGPAGVDAPDRTAELCALYQTLSDAGLIGAELTVPVFCSTIYAIGDTGPAGGIVIIVRNGGVNGTEVERNDGPYTTDLYSYRSYDVRNGNTWYGPSSGTISVIYQMREGIGGFSDACYWFDRRISDSESEGNLWYDFATGDSGFERILDGDYSSSRRMCYSRLVHDF